MDKQAFENACKKVIEIESSRNGIGTLGEKTLHAVVKNYIEPDEDCHEIPINGFVADIYRKDTNEIIEVQTGNFNVMRRKLESFLSECKVTIVYPIPATKWLAWIDEETGETTNKRRSPKKGTPYMAFRELYKIKSYLDHDNFKLLILLIDLEEYRLLNGWSKDRKKGSVRHDRIPKEVMEEYYVERPEDYRMFIPPELPSPFTSVEYSKATKLSRGNAQTALNIMNYLKAVNRVGKKGNSFLYEVPD